MTLDQILIEAYQQSQIHLGFLPALIGAVATIGGAALSAKAANKPQKTTSEIDYVKMAREAKKAGFNPLTALRAGGGNGFATSTTSGGGASPLGAALSALGQNVGGLLPQQRNDPIQQAGRPKPSTALVDYQLRRATGPTAGRIYPVSTSTGKRDTSVTMEQIEKLNGSRMLYGTFVGPRPPVGAGQDGEILPAQVAYKRSDGSLMWTYNPTFIDGDAAIAAGTADAANRAREEYEKYKFVSPTVNGRPSVPTANPRKDRYKWQPR